MGIEPTNGGTTNHCLNHLATLAITFVSIALYFSKCLEVKPKKFDFFFQSPRTGQIYCASNPRHSKSLAQFSVSAILCEGSANGKYPPPQQRPDSTQHIKIDTHLGLHHIVSGCIGIIKSSQQSTLNHSVFRRARKQSTVMYECNRN